jgi:hypothetical protein
MNVLFSTFNNFFRSSNAGDILKQPIEPELNDDSENWEEIPREAALPERKPELPKHPKRIPQKPHQETPKPVWPNVLSHKEQLQSLSKEQKSLYNIDENLIYHKYVNSPFYPEGSSFSKPPKLSEIKNNDSLYKVIIKKDYDVNFKKSNNEDLIKLKTYFKHCHRGFFPLINNTFIDDHPIHSTLLKITKQLVSSYNNLTFSEKIENCEKAISEILFFLIEDSGENDAFTKNQIRAMALSSPQGEVPYSLPKNHPPLELLEIALRNHFTYAILDQEKTQIYKELVTQNKSNNDIENKLDKLYEFVTKQDVYFFDKLNFYERITDYDFRDISKNMLTSCNKLSASKKIEYLEKNIGAVIKKIAIFASEVEKICELNASQINNDEIIVLLDVGDRIDAQSDEMQKVNQPACIVPQEELEKMLREHLLLEMMEQKIESVLNEISTNSTLNVYSKIKLCETAIIEVQSLNAFCKKNTSDKCKVDDNTDILQEDAWELIDAPVEWEAHEYWELTTREEALRQKFLSAMLDQEKERIGKELLTKGNRFPEDFEKRCTQLHQFVTKNGTYAYEISTIYEAITNHDSLNTAVNQAKAQAIKHLPSSIRFWTSSDFLDDLTECIADFDQSISKHLNGSPQVIDPSHPKYIFESKLRIELAYWLSLTFATAFKRELYEPEIAIPPTDKEFTKALEKLLAFVTGNGRFESYSIKHLLLTRIFTSLKEIQSRLETENNKQKKIQNIDSSPYTAETLAEFQILLTTRPNKLICTKIQTLKWAKEEWISRFPQDNVLEEEDSGIIVTELQEETEKEKRKNAQAQTNPITTPPATNNNQIEMAKPVVEIPVAAPVKSYKATDSNIPVISYVDLAFRERLAEPAEDSALFNSLPAIVRMDVLRHVWFLGHYQGKAEEVACRLFKQIPTVEKEFNALKNRKPLVGKNPLGEAFIKRGEELLELYYSPAGIKSNFSHQFQTLPKEGLFFQYVYEMAKEAGVRIESWEYNFAECNWLQPGMIALSIQALERCLHTSVVTEIKIKCKVPAGHNLKIHGEGGDLSWTLGKPLTQIGEETYVYRMEGVKEKVDYKLVLDGTIWEGGSDHTIKAGASEEILPALILPKEPSIAVYYHGEGELFIRGEGPGMSWDEGQKLKSAGDGIFFLEATDEIYDYPFKIRLNDEKWMLGDNLMTENGKHLKVEPKF